MLPLAQLVSSAIARADLLGATLSETRPWRLLLNTCVLGAGTAMLATVIGAPLGLALARVPLPYKPMLRVALAAPIVLPPYVVALAWTYLTGRTGVLASIVSVDLSGWTYSLPAAILVLSLLLYPLPMLATDVAVRGVDGRLDEAGLLVARQQRVLLGITLPLVAPALAGAALLVFVLAISEFSVPALLRVPVYTTEVFTAFAAFYDFDRAVLTAMPLLVVSAIVAGSAAVLTGERLVVARRGGLAPAPMLDQWRRPATVAALIVMGAALGIPTVVLLGEAVAARNLSGIVAASGAAIANSLILAAIAATAVVSVAVWLGYARGRASRRVGASADVVFVVLFAVPSTILGVGLVGLWNRPGVWGSIYGTDAMLVLGSLARFLPVAALLLAATVRRVPVSHEEAAAVAGAGWLRTMRAIVLPQLRGALLVTWVLVFVLAFGELGVSILVAPPGEATLPIRVYTLIANTPASDVAALALFQTLVILLPVAAGAAAISFVDRR
jgi:iron(III) transport system permease protein